MNEEFDNTSRDLLIEELKAAAFELLLQYPDLDLLNFRVGMVRMFPAEVTDVYGDNYDDVIHGISDLWRTEYTDPRTKLTMDFSEWAEAFSSEESIELYHRLVDACKKLYGMRVKYPWID